MKKNWIKRLWVIIPSGFLGLLIGIWLSYTINTFWKDQQLANAYIATFTMILALATAFLAFFTWRIIRSGIEREKRDRKEGLLNEIIEWATESVKSAIYRQEKKPHELWKAILNYKYCISKSEYVNVIATSSFSTLSPLINDVVIKLDKVMKETTKYKDNKTDEKYRLMRDCEDNLTKSVEKLFKEAAKIKARDIGKEEHMSKKEETTRSDETTLKDIEDHLKRQDKKLENGTYFSGYLFGATLIFIAFGLLAGKYVLTTELSLVTYSIVMLIGGSVLMGFAWYKRSKPPK